MSRGPISTRVTAAGSFRRCCLGIYARTSPLGHRGGRGGGPDTLKRFVDACHSRGLGVWLDAVHNYLGRSGKYLPRFGPYFSGKHDTPRGAGVNLDDESAFEVRRWVIDNALMWLRDYHRDAVRFDAVRALADDSPLQLLAKLSLEVDALSCAVRRPLSLVAEPDLNLPAMVTPVECGGLGMTAQWSDDFHHALHAPLTDESQGYYADFAASPSRRWSGR